MSENETGLQVDTRKEKLQKIHKSTIDLHNLGALKYEETKPTFQPDFPPYHTTPQSFATTATPTTKRPKFLIFPAPDSRPGGGWSTSLGNVEKLRRSLRMKSGSCRTQ